MQRGVGTRLNGYLFLDDSFPILSDTTTIPSTGHLVCLVHQLPAARHVVHRLQHRPSSTSHDQIHSLTSIVPSPTLVTAFTEGNRAEDDTTGE